MSAQTQNIERQSKLCVHKSIVLHFLRLHPEDYRKIAPEYKGTAEQYIAAIENAPGQWFLGGELQDENFQP